MTQQPAEPFGIPPETLGWRLKRALDWGGISSKEMATELDVSEGTISRWSNDVGAPPRSIYLRAWANKCRVPYEWLAEELPRVDSNHQPADWLPEPAPNGRPGTAELAAMGKPIDQLRQHIRHGARQTAAQEWATG